MYEFDNDSYTHYAYFDKKNSIGNRWRLTDNRSIELMSDTKNIVYIEVPSPVSHTKQIVYLSTKYWYEAAIINEIEPIFEGNKFKRYVYCIGDQKQLVMSVDFYTTKFEAIKSAITTTLSYYLYKITGKLF